MAQAHQTALSYLKKLAVGRQQQRGGSSESGDEQQPGRAAQHGRGDVGGGEAGDKGTQAKRRR